MGAIRLLGTDMAGVAAAVAQAQATADNARQMVLNRDPKLAAVESETTRLDHVATTLAQAIPASEAVHNALSARIAALEAKPAAFGYQATTALALLATKDYTVTLSRPMPTSTYTAKVHVDPAVAGKLNATVTAQTTTTVTVRTSALLAVGVGGFTVLAWA